MFLKHRAYFNAEQDMDVALHCLYKASPAPIEIRWFKESNRIHNSEKYEITDDVQNHHDRTTLLVRKVTKEDLTKYHCEVENQYGVKRENITVGLFPTPAQYVTYKYMNGILYTDWIIKSHQVLTELQFLYRTNEVIDLQLSSFKLLLFVDELYNSIIVDFTYRLLGKAKQLSSQTRTK